MIVLRNAFYEIQTVMAGGKPVAENHFSCYVFRERVKVDIKKHYDLITNREFYNCILSIGGQEVVKESDIEKFCGIVEAMGYQIGYHVDEGVTLTQLGEQEVSLSSSIPYLFSESRKMVDRQ